ncbi:MAG: TraB/GumN family protein [Gammaproteobacteria bacterium]|nr:TraB/GumN family protein [Gammaproteobacteria bacterium]
MHSQNIIRIHRLDTSVVLAIILFFLMAAFSQAGTDKSHGLLWEVSKPGKPSSYLFGTIHSEAPEVVKFARPVKEAFDASRSVILEMLMDMDAMMYSSTAMLMTDGRSLSDLTGRRLFTQAAAAIKSRGIPEVVLERMKPWAVAVTLSMPAPETGQVMDMILYQEALQDGKQVYGLETVREQLDVFELMPEADQLESLKDALASFPEIDAMHAELLAAYRQRDLAGLMAINEASMQVGNQRLAEDFQKRLISDRNFRMYERMQQYLQQGKAFVAVGALHLPGQDGLLQLLEQGGYTIRRVY